MKNFIGILVLLVVSMLAYGNASPPDDVGTMNTVKVVTADVDHFVVNMPTIEADVYTIDLPVVVQVENLSDEGTVLIMVREVTSCRKISILKAESGSATENAAIALDSACTDLDYVTQSPPFLITKNVATNNSLRRNLQHTNFGYPLSAD